VAFSLEAGTNRRFGSPNEISARCEDYSAMK
jgi:hypothetical protein